MHMRAHSALRLVKAGHTIVWAIFAACILAIPVLAWLGQQERAAVLIMVVLVEPHSVDVRWLDGVGR